MKCEYLVASGNISACSGLGKPYVPSLLELRDYCETIAYQKCNINKANNNLRECVTMQEFLPKKR